MVQVDPRPGLRLRVANRLAAVEASTAAWPRMFAFGRRAAILSSAAAVVLLLATFGWLREPTPRPEADVGTGPASAPAAAASPPTVSSAAPAPEPVAAAPAPRVASPHAAPLPPVRTGIFGERTGRIRAANVPAHRDDVVTDEDLVVEPALPLDGGIQPLEPITIEPIRLAPLTIRPVTVSAPSGGK
jgi:hypothetical protein